MPLYQHVIAGRRIFDLFADGEDARAGLGRGATRRSIPSCCGSRATTRAREGARPRAPRGGSGPTVARGNPGRVGAQARRGGRAARAGRAAAGDRVRVQPGRVRCRRPQCLDAHLRLDHAMRSATRSSRSSRTAAPTSPTRICEVLGYHEFLDGLTRGVAAHHAGMLPTFKECVEELFLVGCVGWSSPRRRWRSASTCRPGRWSSRSCRSGTARPRRHHAGGVHPAHRPGRTPGIDVEGHGVVLWQQGLDPQAVAGLASTRTYPLRSSLPSVVQHGGEPGPPVRAGTRARAARVLVRAVPGRQGGRGARPAAPQERGRARRVCRRGGCDLGDFIGYAALRDRLTETEKGLARTRRAHRRQEILASLAPLRPGDVILVPSGRFAGQAVVVDPGHSTSEAPTGGPRPYVLTAERQARRLNLKDFPTPVVSLTRRGIPRKLQRPQPQAAPRPA